VESKYIHRSHNVSVLVYHFVCSAKYRRVVINKEVDGIIKETCLEIEKRYEMRFLEIGMDGDHAHFLIQGVPKYNPSGMIRIVKNLTARAVFEKHPEVKKQLWGGEFWSDGFYVSTVGQHGNEKTISTYVKNQGNESNYQVLHKQLQLALF